MILDPGRYSSVPVYTLLEAVARGYIAADRRFLHAILDRPAEAVPDLVRFAAAEHSDEPVDLSNVLLDLFRYLRAADAVSFYADLVRRDPENISDDLVEALVALGATAVDPLLSVLNGLDEPGDVLFILASLGVRDPRIFDALIARLNVDASDGALCLEIYGDAAAIPALESALGRLPAGDSSERRAILQAIEVLSAPQAVSSVTEEPFDIWEPYPEEDFPEFEILSDEERLAMLESPAPALRLKIVDSYHGAELSLAVRARLLELAKTDPEAGVRGSSWEALQDAADQPELRRTMLAVLKDPNASIEERGGVAVALAQQSDNRTVFEAIEALYADARSRAKALKAMARSFDRRFAQYPPRHLDDPDADLRRQAIWGVGYLALSSEAPRLATFFEEREYRSDALFAYALAMPGETSPGRAHSLLQKVDKVSGGLTANETELVKIALDQRLMFAGHKAVFSPDEEEPAAAAEAEPAPKAGRNDPCHCGSGKKYKKCCGA